MVVNWIVPLSSIVGKLLVPLVQGGHLKAVKLARRKM